MFENKSCIKNLEECYCPCHNNPDIKHVMACCRKCPKCSKNILRVFYEDHVKNCKESFKQYWN